MTDTLLDGVTLVPFVNAMHEIDTVSVAAFKEHELDAYFGMVYGMLKAGVRDHQISDSAVSACCAVRNDPVKYMDEADQKAVRQYLLAKEGRC